MCERRPRGSTLSLVPRLKTWQLSCYCGKRKIGAGGWGGGEQNPSPSCQSSPTGRATSGVEAGEDAGRWWANVQHGGVAAATTFVLWKFVCSWWQPGTNAVKQTCRCHTLFICQGQWVFFFPFKLSHEQQRHRPFAVAAREGHHRRLPQQRHHRWPNAWSSASLGERHWTNETLMIMTKDLYIFFFKKIRKAKYGQVWQCSWTT